MPSTSPLQVLAKAGEILNVLGRYGPLSAAEITALVEEPRSSVYRLLHTLRDLDYVTSRRRGKFELGIRLFQLGGSVASRFSIRSAALPPMEKLHADSEQTILLFVRRDDAAVCVERLDGRWVRLEVVDVGETLPLYTGAAPRILLAYGSDEQVAAYLESVQIEQHNERSPATPQEVRELLATIRRTGYAVSDQDIVKGVASIAAPVRDHTGSVVAAMSYSGLAETLLGGGARRTSIAAITQAANEASRRLGWIEGTELAPAPEAARAGARR